VRKLLILLVILSLIVPVLFLGCEGDDGATGATGAQGPQGPAGPGLQVAEGCVVCHGAGKIVDVAEAHDPPTGTATANITSAAFNPADNTASITFTFAATDSAGNPLPDNILLTPSGSNLTHARFTIARLVPGQEIDGPFGTYRTPNEWFHYGPTPSHRSPSQLTFSGGVYTFTFVNGVALDTAWEDYTHRVGIEIYNLPGGVRSVNPTFTFVPSQGAGPYTFAQTRDIVTTEACNECHNPLGYTPPSGFTGGESFHGSRRVETKYCGLCHNSNNPLAPQSVGGTPVPIPFAKLVHGIHTAQDLLIFEGSENVGDFTEVLFPQDVRNCTKCHKGAANSDNWRTVPSIVACGSCHTDVNFTTGANHPGGPASNNTCGACHNPNFVNIEASHRTVNATPNNPGVPSGLANFEYFIDNVSVDGAGVASVTFRIEKDGAPLDLSTCPPAGFTGGPSFILAWALPQDNVIAPVDYTNTQSPDDPSTANGNGAGDAPSVSICSLINDNLVTGTAAGYTATLLSSSWERSYSFPAGAKMRAVALQSYFTQTNFDLDGVAPLDNVARHTPSVVWPPPGSTVPGDTVRRQVVKSGYDPVTGEPFGCLECHEILELHGGSRVNNVQVCVMCHNPNKSSSGRTVLNPSQAVIDAVGSDPLVYPEATNNFKEMIHGIHRASDRPYEFVRNRLNGFYYNWSEVTFPGDLMDCTKCHIGDSYVPSSIPAGALKTTERITTGNTAETRADIIAFRGTVPNDTDLVNSPIASACYYCHDSNAAASHMVLNGGKIRAKRTDVFLTFPTP